MEPVFVQVKRAAIGILCADSLMLLLFALLGQFSGSVVLGALFGSVFALANLFVLGVMVYRSLAMPPQRAQRALGVSYVIRYAFMGLVLYAALTSPHLHAAAVIAPLFVPKLVLQTAGILKK